MAASYPGSAKAFSAKVDNVDNVQASHVNDIQTEIEAIETDLLVMRAGYTRIASAGTYVNATQFTIAGVNLTALLAGFPKIRLVNSTTKYGYVLSASYSGGNTVVNLVANDSYSLANAAITNIDISYGNPPDHPGWLDWTPTFGGFSAAPQGIHRFKIDGQQCHISVYESVSGTSNDTIFTLSAPVPIAVTSRQSVAQVFDNGVAQNSSAMVNMGGGGSTITVYKDPQGSTWTATGGKLIRSNFSYEI